MQPHKIDAVEAYGLGKFDPTKSRKYTSGELIEFIESVADQPIVGLGHSLGADLTLMAAAQRPDLFSQVIIMDPPIFEWKRRLLIGLARAFKMEKKLGPGGAALRRRNNFKTKKEALEYFASSSIPDEWLAKWRKVILSFG